MKFVSLKESNRKGKRYVMVLDEPKRTLHFGSDVGSTYIDHGDKTKRENYLKRHMVNEDWDSVNPGSLSKFLLWGKSKSLKRNLAEYLERFNIEK